jgi:hypothetical protein
MKNKNAQVLPLTDKGFTIGFEIAFFAENTESRTELLNVTALADEQTELKALFGKPLRMFEIKAPMLLKKARILRTQTEKVYEIDSKGKKGALLEVKQVQRLRAIKASELFMELRVVSEHTFKFATFERVAVPYNGSEASMHSTLQNLFGAIYETLTLHALTDSDAAAWAEARFMHKGANRANSIEARKAATLQLMGLQVSEIVQPKAAQ